MHPALWISVTGLEAQNTDIRVISNNLANVSTTGYKKSRAVFEDLLYQNVRQPGGQSTENTELPSGLMLGTGVKTLATQKIFSQGSVINTQNQLDLAINGKGFFQITRPDGTIAYTRDGSFQLNSQGQIVTGNGYLLDPNITVPDDTVSITIGTDGIVSVLTQGNNTPQQIGNIEISDFINPAGLQPIGENQYTETAASGTPTTGTPGLTGLGSLAQGSLESSNVNVVEELVRLIQTQRAYEMNAKSVETVDGMLRYLSQNL
ncbi:flagellar basal-body rod protein FlgG [Candidatus Berkiella cookevillensis]|uniref:Flagellar basal-body rod protein FlgG n=1 Tax=Candidatus Berkiella cookevillensis TaxID=437022 RepID=A0A0Q9YGW3_9GAMM|nr:flagellar basal-body rod protein FlgG [Candidatus Berkiella cookevillensis]MCS5708625.1 flagellar basal-body rod protein FlgG [Candidatus Berkiella cookevillensis]